jgi:hypothetical protein
MSVLFWGLTNKNSEKYLCTAVANVFVQQLFETEILACSIAASLNLS